MPKRFGMTLRWLHWKDEGRTWAPLAGRGSRKCDRQLRPSISLDSENLTGVRCQATTTRIVSIFFAWWVATVASTNSVNDNLCRRRIGLRATLPGTSCSLIRKQEASMNLRLETKRRLRHSVFGLVFFAICALSAIAQVDRGAIVGRVVDASGAVVPRAAVTVTNKGT